MATPARTLDRTRSSKAVGEYRAPAPAANRMVPCAKSKWHKFHAANEACGECPPPAPVAVVADQPDWYVDMVLGVVSDARRWPEVLTRPDFVRLERVQPHDTIARVMCGCGRTRQRCTVYEAKRFPALRKTLCEVPAIIKSDEWKEVV